MPEKDAEGDSESEKQQQQRRRRRQRLWLYGNMFLYMLDVSQDIISPRAVEVGGLEGGGDIMHHDDDSGDLGKRRAFSTFVYRDVLGVGVIGGQQEENHLVTEHKEERGDDDDDDDGGDTKMNGADDTSKGDSDSESEKRQMEVVIIERPMWDVEQPPRFDGGQDWES